MDIQQFLELCQMAQDAGFSEVQIAADPKDLVKKSTAEMLTPLERNDNVVFPVR